MAWQLVYTSAPALLDAGRTGFGTVARHESIRPALQTELERISQFSREQGLSKDRILYYHRVIDLRGERHHILSRIKDAGSDYTGRTNHIAHHIVLTASEADQAFRANRCTPADMILWITSNGLWREQWNEPTRILNASEEIAVGSIPARVSLPAVTWGSLTGDAANAAILAPGGSATEGCWLLYRADQASQLLSIIGESICLNPNPWAISFATDTQPTDRIEELRWRGVCAGSPVERTARQSVRPVLDLGNPATLPRPVESSAHLAETGLMKAPPPISSHIREVDSGRVERGSRLAEQSVSGSSCERSAAPSISSLRSKSQPVKTSTRSKKSQSALNQLIWVGVLILIVGASWGLTEFYFYTVDTEKASSLRKEICKKAKEWHYEPNNTVDVLNIKWRGIDLFEEPKEIKYWNELRDDVTKKTSEPTRFDISQKEKSTNPVVANFYKSLAKDSSKNDKATQASQPIASPSPTPPPIVKSNQIITLQIPEKISAADGQIIALGAASDSGLPVSYKYKSGPCSINPSNSLTITGSGTITLTLSAPGNANYEAAETNIQIVVTRPEAKISKIEFWDPLKDKSISPWNKFFESYKPGDTNLPYSWNTNAIESPLSFINKLQNAGNAITWTNKAPFYGSSPQEIFNQTASNSPIFIFSKKDSSNQISVVICIKGTATNNNTPFYATSEANGSLNLYANTEVMDFLQRATNGNPALKIIYEIREKDADSPKYSGESLPKISEIINTKCANDISRKEELQNQLAGLTNAESSAGSFASGSPAPVPQELKAVEDTFLNAGTKIFEGIQNDKKESYLLTNAPLASYANWKNQKGMKDPKPTYKDYLSEVLDEISKASTKVDFSGLARKAALKNPDGDVPSFIKKLTEIIKNINKNGMEGDGSPDFQNKNKRILNNLKNVFTPENAQRFSEIPSLNEGYISKEEKKKNEDINRLNTDLIQINETINQCNKLKKSLQKDSLSTDYKAQIQLKDGDRPIFIFTSP